jgi:uncharacterized protein YkwD
MPFILLLLNISLTEIRVNNVNDTTAKMTSLYPEIDGDRRLESLLFILTNKERKKRGLEELKLDKRLRIAARQHSNDMLNRKYFSHNSGDKINETPLHRIYNSGLPVLVVGENLAENKGDLVPTLLKGNPDSLSRIVIKKWMNSPAHKENILNPEFTHLGIGSVTYKDIQKVTQNFAEEREFSVDSVLAKLDKKRYLISLYMNSDVSKISIFDNGEPLDGDFVHIHLGEINFPLERNSGSHKIELCLKDEKFYRCGVRLFVYTDSPVKNMFQTLN